MYHNISITDNINSEWEVFQWENEIITEDWYDRIIQVKIIFTNNNKPMIKNIMVEKYENVELELDCDNIYVKYQNNYSDEQIDLYDSIIWQTINLFKDNPEAAKRILWL